MTIAEFLSGFLSAFRTLLLDASAWMLLGFLVAGVLAVLAPTNGIFRFLGRPGPGSVFRAALVGLPLPLCSCGVIPTALGLRQRGASKGATVSFLVSTPETGVDSIAVSWALLGPVLTIVRPLAALITAVTAGLLTDATSPRAETPTGPPDNSCGVCQEPLLDGNKHRHSLLQRARRALRFMLVDLADDLAGWLLLGFVLAAAIMAMFPEQDFGQYVGNGIEVKLALLVVGVPLYICATASTPIAAGLIAAGLSPGSALVLLLAGPATNVATMTAVRGSLGTRVLVVYLLTVGGMSLLIGVGVDAALQAFRIDALLPGAMAASTRELPWAFRMACVGLFATIMVVSLARVGARRLRRMLNPGAPKEDSCCAKTCASSSDTRDHHEHEEGSRDHADRAAPSRAEPGKSAPPL